MQRNKPSRRVRAANHAEAARKYKTQRRLDWANGILRDARKLVKISPKARLGPKARPSQVLRKLLQYLQQDPPTSGSKYF